MSVPLSTQDPAVFALIQHEQQRQFRGLELIASENFTSRAVLDALGTCFTNKYSEGLPGKRYYGGNEYVDELENLCIDRCLAAFHLNKDEWGVNVQPYSGSTANMAVLTALLQPHERIMGLDLPSGGHLTHGYYTAKKKISATSIFWESLPYRVNSSTGLVDYDKLEETALVYRPRVLICGASAYPREWDYKRLRAIADAAGAYLFCDMAHFAGLVAGGVLNSPFEYCDVVSTTTHKSLRGPRAGVIFFKKALEERMNFAVFPTLQGGPHNNTIAAIAVQMAEVASPSWKDYAQQIQKNARALAGALTERGYVLATGGTDNHLILWDLRPLKLTGNKFELLCDAAAITLNKNSINGDTSALSPGGVRVGTPALTSRGFKEADFVQVAVFLDRAIKISLDIQSALESAPGPDGKKAPVTLVAFKEAIASSDAVKQLKKDVEEFASKFFMPGFDAK